MKKNTTAVIGICILLLIISGILFWRGQNRSAATEEFYTALPDRQESWSSSFKQEETEPPVSEECAVYISGAVRKPGLYHYKGTARVCDAIEAVGGFLPNAASDSLNLARRLDDGEQIYVPTKKEVAREKKNSNKVQQKPTGDDTEKRDNSSETSSDGKININTATAAELVTLPGIGEAKAALIINYREEHGSFSKIEDLMQISGIKEGIFQKIKNNITTS